MKEFFCKVCNNTGCTSMAGMLDCIAPGCEVATTRAAFDKWLLREGYGHSGIKEWAIYRHAVRTEMESAALLLDENERLRNTIAGMQSRTGGMLVEKAEAAAPAAAVVTVDTPELWNALRTWANTDPVSIVGQAPADAVIAHIDAHTAAVAEKAEKDGYVSGYTKATVEHNQRVACILEPTAAPQQHAQAEDYCVTYRSELAAVDAVDASVQHAQALPSLEELTARMMPPTGYEGCSVIERNGQLIWLRKEDRLPTDLICFYDGDCRDVLTPYDSRVQPPMKLVQQHAQAALTTEQIDAIANTFNWHNARCCGVHYRFARAILAASQQPAAAPSAPEPCTDPALCEQQGCANPRGRCEEAPAPTWKCASCGATSAASCIASGCGACEQDEPAAAPATHPQEAGWDERAGFEAWCKTLDNAAVRLKGTDQYVVPDVQAAWKAWQARAALASPALQVAAVPEGMMSTAQALLHEQDEACATDPMFALLEMAEGDEETNVSAKLLLDLFKAVRATPFSALQVAAPDLSSLQRYDQHEEFLMRDSDGDYVKFDDVKALLAAPSPALPATADAAPQSILDAIEQGLNDEHEEISRAAWKAIASRINAALAAKPAEDGDHA